MHQRYQRLPAAAKRYDDSPLGLGVVALTRAGIEKISANLKEQLVTVEGNAAPSAIVEAIQNTGRDAILRGSGKTNSMFTHLLLCLVLRSSNRLLLAQSSLSGIN